MTKITDSAPAELHRKCKVGTCKRELALGEAKLCDTCVDRYFCKTTRIKAFEVVEVSNVAYKYRVYAEDEQEAENVFLEYVWDSKLIEYLGEESEANELYVEEDEVG